MLISAVMSLKRVAIAGHGKSGGIRTLLAYKTGNKAFFVYGFAKNSRANINTEELKGLNLENAVGREKDVQDIDVNRKFIKLVVTLLVMRDFLDFLGASRACAYFRDPTAFSRLKAYAGILLSFSDKELKQAMKSGALIEVINNG
jgi:hypothetical protein